MYPQHVAIPKVRMIVLGIILGIYNSRLSVTLSASQLSILEGGAATYQLALSSQPTADVVVTVIPPAELSIGLGSSGAAMDFLFTPSNWSSSHDVDITATSDNIVIGTQELTISHSVASADLAYGGPSGSSSSMYFVPGSAQVTVFLYDDDIPGIFVNKAGLTMSEGLGGDFDVVLATMPAADVVVTITSPDSRVLVDGAASTQLTFTSGGYDTPQTVTVTTTSTPEASPTLSSFFQLSSTSNDPNFGTSSGSTDGQYFLRGTSALSFTMYDSNLAGVLITPAVEYLVEGGSAVSAYAISLTSEPTSNVVVDMSSDSSRFEINGAATESLVFTSLNWDQPQAVFLAATYTAEKDNEFIVTVSHSVSSVDSNYNLGGASEQFTLAQSSVQVTVLDVNYPGVLLSSSLVRLREGGSQDVSVRLLSKPAAAVDVALVWATTSDIVVSSNVVSFTTANWDSEQVVSLTAPLDDIAISGEKSEFILQVLTGSESDADYNFPDVNIYPSSNITVHLYDDDTPGVILSSSEVVVAEGFSGTYTVALLSQPLLSEVVTVDVTVDTGDASQITISPQTLTFSNLNWDSPQTVTVSGVDDSVSESDVYLELLHTVSTNAVSAYSEALLNEEQLVFPSTLTIQVVDDDASGIVILGTPLRITEGDSAVYSVVLSSPPSATVYIDIAPEDNSGSGGAALVTNATISGLTFSSANWDVPQYVEVTSVDDSIDHGSVYTLRVDHTAISQDTSFNSPNVHFTPVAGTVYVFVAEDEIACRLSCSPGSHSASCNDTQVCQDCPPGFYCEGACSSPSACPAGTFRSAYGGADISDCEVCSNGTYAPSSGMSTCSVCPAGWSCEDKASIPVICAPGSFSPEGDWDCRVCPSGQYVDTSGAEACIDCPAGYHCADPSQPPTRCASGEYSTGNSIVCEPCPAGRSCQDRESAAVCPAGTYSLEGWAGCVSCPAGAYCPTADQEPIWCQSGSYSVGGAAQCTDCPEGTYTATNGSVRCGSCPGGYSCQQAGVDPVPCDPGQYSLPGWLTCKGCPDGTFVDESGAETCEVCPPGSSCANPAVAPTLCLDGYYSEGGAVSCKVCPSGTRSTDDRTNCGPCPAGKACFASTAATEDCLPGYWSPLGDPGPCEICPAGYYCPDATDYPLPCPTGQYSYNGSLECTACEAGFACLTPSSFPVPCGPGYYSPEGSTSCKACPRGYKCEDVALSPSLCPNGTYSLGASEECISCGAGQACPDAAFPPVDCPHGYTSRAESTECTPCPAGYECPSASADPVECPDGTYSLGLTTRCYTCPAGSQCADKTDSPKPLQAWLLRTGRKYGVYTMPCWVCLPICILEH